jgi:hypothetical protein
LADGLFVSGVVELRPRASSVCCILWPICCDYCIHVVIVKGLFHGVTCCCAVHKAYIYKAANVWRAFFVEKLVAAYFMKSRSMLQDAMVIDLPRDHTHGKQTLALGNTCPSTCYDRMESPPINFILQLGFLVVRSFLGELRSTAESTSWAMSCLVIAQEWLARRFNFSLSESDNL